MKELQKYATRQVPRYTSYPTAPHFTDQVGADDYRMWLSRLSPDQDVSLYVHVPYCRKICWYCGCNMKLAKRYEPVADYVESLIAELDLVVGYLPGRMRISHLHWGGGTPTALEPDDLARVMDRIRDHFDFRDEAEIAIEADPRTLTGVMIDRLAALEFNRASFGVQEFDLKVQTTINRVQPPEMVRKAVTGLREAGVSNINFDLIYGLPHQTVDTLLRTIELTSRMAPDRIALFGYAHVPWKAARQRMLPEDALPGAAQRAAQANASSRALCDAGYQAIGLDHFALPGDSMAIAARAGTLRRNFQGYTTDAAPALLGIGATSIGRTPSGYVQNISETGAWARSVAEGRLPVARGVAIGADDRLRGDVIERVMCQGTVDLDAVARDHGGQKAWYASHLDALRELEIDGLIRTAGTAITLTDLGWQYSRAVAAVFDVYLPQQVARHSVAV